MSESGGTEPTVLLVDDDPGIVEVYEAFLVDHYEVLTATSGAEGIERIDDRVDVALLDRVSPRERVTERVDDRWLAFVLDE